MFLDPTNKGYSKDMKLVVEGLPDGRFLFPGSNFRQEYPSEFGERVCTG
jgi:hypothetical protein